jgi:membrane-associated phospholipid phosphatase
MKHAADFPHSWWCLPPALLALTAPLWLHWWEPQQFVAINTLCAPVPALVWTGLSLLGNGWGVLGVTAPLLVWSPRLLWGWLCAAPFAIAFARSGKFFIESPRPAAVVDNAQMRVVGEYLHNVSMPSGHTLTAFAVATGIFLAIAAGRRWRYAWLLALALGTGLSRIAVGAHWPGDVAVGAALGLLSGMLGHLLWLRVPARWWVPASWPLRVVAVLQLVAVVHLLTEELDFAENQPLQVVLAVVVVISLTLFARQNLTRQRRR